MKTDRIYQLLSLTAVTAVAAFYHWSTSLGIKDNPWYPNEGYAIIDGLRFLEPLWRIIGYAALALLILFIIFGDRITKRLEVKAVD